MAAQIPRTYHSLKALQLLINAHTNKLFIPPKANVGTYRRLLMRNEPQHDIASDCDSNHSCDQSIQKPIVKLKNILHKKTADGRNSAKSRNSYYPYCLNSLCQMYIGFFLTRRELSTKGKTSVKAPTDVSINAGIKGTEEPVTTAAARPPKVTSPPLTLAL